MQRAVTFLYGVDDIDDLPAKLRWGYLRPSCHGRLRQLFGLTHEEAELAINTFLGKEVCGEAPGRPPGAVGGAGRTPGASGSL